jgi:4-amino-4-deoxy-L-arabinose transferase-like glycosyltransferase
MRLWFGVAVFLVMTAPWFFELWRQGGWEFLRVFLIYNHVGRFAGGESGHHQPIYYYLSQFPAGFLPWSLLVIPVIYRVAKRNADLNGSERMGVLFAVCWFISGFVFLSIASTKRVLYLMPLFAPASLLTAWFLDLTLKGVRVRRFEGVFMRLFGLIPMILGVAAVPLYLHFCRVYDFAWSWRTGGWIITFSLTSVVFAVEALWRHRESMKHFWSLSSVSVLSLLLLSLLAVIPLLDRYKSFVPFCRDINAVVPGKAPLYAYQPDETLRGAVPFYTGRHLDEVETLDVLSEIGKKRQSVFVAVRDKRGNLEREILGTSRFSVITRRGADKDRSRVLLKSGTAGSYEESW